MEWLLFPSCDRTFSSLNVVNILEVSHGFKNLALTLPQWRLPILALFLEPVWVPSDLKVWLRCDTLDVST